MAPRSVVAQNQSRGLQSSRREQVRPTPRPRKKKTYPKATAEEEEFDIDDISSDEDDANSGIPVSIVSDDPTNNTHNLTNTNTSMGSNNKTKQSDIQYFFETRKLEDGAEKLVCIQCQ
jgi:hypothetical protein